ncbi:DUF695 domain-containing protein [Bailinhaonella thermotolerans]|uniref:DUF695 domain-containing protein n=1 Tax=Bailinhaonella thermotolerans TaxID=1070861 RepID=A0A3A4AA76_9ACTN|nr:DUF695 domain-containing protein [Bailinhaonella thermotolerans]RJL25101.1 DUF695 domain-containing protein [Bailinhaonella thermotolerans]
MRLFGRKGNAIREFWEWWAEARPRLDKALAAGDAEALAAEITPAVARLNPGLAWETAPGSAAPHALVLSAAGDLSLRSTTRRWLLAAPPPDATWEFRDARPARADAAGGHVTAGGRRLDLAELVLGLRVPRNGVRVDVTAYHPVFPDLPEDARLEAAYAALDALLGEDEVARWIGDVAAATAAPIDAVPALHLPAVVADVAADVQPDQWALMRGETGRGSPLAAMTRYPLRPVDHPLFDEHIAITLPYRTADDEGFPTGDSLDALREFEEGLQAALGESPYDGSGSGAVLVAHTSSDRTRVFHVYADPDASVAGALKSLVARWPEGRGRVEAHPDPAWTAVAPFLS